MNIATCVIYWKVSVSSQPWVHQFWWYSVRGLAEYHEYICWLPPFEKALLDSPATKKIKRSASDLEIWIHTLIFLGEGGCLPDPSAESSDRLTFSSGASASIMQSFFTHKGFQPNHLTSHFSFRGFYHFFFLLKGLLKFLQVPLLELCSLFPFVARKRPLAKSSTFFMYCLTFLFLLFLLAGRGRRRLLKLCNHFLYTRGL